MYVAFGGSRRLPVKYFAQIVTTVKYWWNKGYTPVVGDSWGTDYLVACACSGLEIPCKVVVACRNVPRLSYIAAGHIPQGIELYCSVLSKYRRLSRRLSERTRYVASMGRVGVAFGAGKGTLGVFARTMLKQEKKVFWHPLTIKMQEINEVLYAYDLEANEIYRGCYLLKLRGGAR